MRSSDLKSRRNKRKPVVTLEHEGVRLRQWSFEAESTAYNRLSHDAIRKPSKASPSIRHRASDNSTQWAYFTEHPYGLDVGVLTGFPAIASSSACDT
jgi:hypothetical protein